MAWSLYFIYCMGIPERNLSGNIRLFQTNKAKAEYQEKGKRYFQRQAFETGSDICFDLLYMDIFQGRRLFGFPVSNQEYVLFQLGNLSKWRIV